MGRAPCCEKMGLKKGPWTPEEDQILINYIHRHGHTNWRALPKQAGLLRCGKSCRLRWTNYLRPDIKRGNFTTEEEETIINLHEMLGNRWSAIAAKLPGRTDNEIKNVWHTHLKKRASKPDPESSTEPTRKRTRNPKVTKGITVSKKSKSVHVKCMVDTEDDNNNNDNDNDASPRHANPSTLRDPISPQPCTSEISTVTSTSTSTSASENDNRGKENVGDQGDLDEINEDFWMEVLSVEDTAMSTRDFPCVSQYDPNTSPDLLMKEPMFESSFKGHGDDMDYFWYNLLTKSDEMPELSEIL